METVTKNKTIKWLYTVPGRKKLYILLLTVIEAIYGASGVLYAMLLRGVVDAAVNGSASGFKKYIVLLVCLTLCQIALRALIRGLVEFSKSSLENVFKSRLVSTLLKKDYMRISAVHSGDWLNRLTNDTKVVADSCTDILPGLSEMIVKLVSALIMLIILEPRFAFVFIPGGLILMLFTWLFRRVLKSLHKQVQESDGKLRIFLQEHIGNMMVIRSFAAEKRTIDEANEKMNAHKSRRMRRNHFSNLCNIGFGMAINGMYLLGVGWCGYGILQKTITFGTLTAVMQLISQIQMPFANITGYLPRYYSMIASAERLMEAEDFEEDGEDAKSAAELAGFYRELAALELKNIDFAYYPPAEDAGKISKDEMPVVINDFSFRLNKGEYVAFTGHSGCGKSTVIKLLMCVLRQDSGSRDYVMNDGRRGELTSAYRRLFAYVPQGNALMNGTIREVVSFAVPEAANDEARLEKALKVSCADEFVSELEGGIDTLLGERGTGLSEGQMQRLAIARAVFSGCPVMLFDEATSALDADTEKKVLENIRELDDRTLIIITHRKAALEICDRVFAFSESGATEV